MKISDKSADYIAMESYWKKAGALVDGAEAVRALGEVFLPKFPQETDKDYQLRKKTARYTNVYGDILEGLAQKPFAQELQLKEDKAVNQRLKELSENIDGRGNHIHVFAGEVFYSGINNAIDWILVDYPRVEGVRTVADERAAGVRPYWVRVPADHVLEVRSDFIAGHEVLTKVRILEKPDIDGERVKQVRVFERTDEGTFYQLWREVEGKDGKDWEIVEEGLITINEIPMVPFVTGRRKGDTWQFKPPMRDAADLQIELYQQETALKHIEIMACFPMLAANGVELPKDAEGNIRPVPVGPAAVLGAPPNADGNHGQWTWIEPSAESMRFLSAHIQETINQLREIGRQPLTSQSGNLTRITTMFAAQKGNSAVQAWALALKDTLENALKLTAKWMGLEQEPEVKIFTDFGLDDMDDQAPQTLLKMRETGDLSHLTLWDEMKRRNILSAEFDAEIEDDRLMGEVPGYDERESFATQLPPDDA